MLLSPQLIVPRRAPIVVASGSTLKTGLISFWELENTSWTDAVVGTGNDLTGHGTPTTTTGKVGNAAQLTAASSQFLSHVSNAGLQASGDFSFAAWVNADTLSDGKYVASKSGGFGTFEWKLSTNFGSGMQFRFEVLDGGSSLGTVTEPTSLSPATWYYVVVTYTASIRLMSIYVNAGTATTATASAGLVGQAADFQIGAAASANFWDGKIDQAGWWNKVLSSGEITQLYAAGAGLSYAAM